jgi:hypothetical protein
LLNQMSEEQIAKLLKSLKSNPWILKPYSQLFLS